MPKNEKKINLNDVPAIKNYAKLIQKLDKIQSNGLRSPMTVEDIAQLKDLHQQINTFCLEALGNPLIKLDTEDRKKIIKLSDHIHKEMGLLELVQPDANGVYPTYHEALRISDRMIVDISNKNIVAVGGFMSQRLPIEVVDANGVHRKGFFTKHLRYREQETFSSSLQELPKRYPRLAKLVNELAKLSFEDIYDALYDTLGPDEKKTKRGEQLWDAIISPFRLDKKGKMIKPAFEKLLLKLNMDPDLLSILTDNELAAVSGAFTVYHNQIIQLDAWQIKENEVMAKKNNGMTEVATMFGKPDILARSTDMTLVSDGKLTQGVFMENAKGHRIHNIHPENPAIGLRKVNFDTPELKKSVADLQIIDYICGNVDRHPGNFHYILEEDGADLKAVGVQGIDNDLSFLDLDVDADPKNMTTLNELGVISEDIANKILGMQEAPFKQALERQGLGATGIEKAWNRVRSVQDRIEEGLKYYQNKSADERVPAKGKLLVVKDSEWTNINVKDLTSLISKEKHQDFLTLFSILEISDRKVKASYDNYINTYYSPEHPEMSKNILTNLQRDWSKNNSINFTLVAETQQEQLMLLDQKDKYFDLLNQFKKTETKNHKNTDEYQKMIDSFEKFQKHFDKMVKDFSENKGSLLDRDYNRLKLLQARAIEGVEEYISKKSANPKTEFGRNRLSLAKNLRGSLGLDVEELRNDLTEAFMKEQHAELNKINTEQKELEKINSTKNNLNKQVKKLDDIVNTYPENHPMHDLGMTASEMMKTIGANILNPQVSIKDNLYELAFIMCYEKANEKRLSLDPQSCMQQIENSVEKLMDSKGFEELQNKIDKDQMYELVTNPQKRTELFNSYLAEKKQLNPSQVKKPDKVNQLNNVTQVNGIHP